MVLTLAAPSIHSKQDFKLAILPKRVSVMDVWRSDMPPLTVLVCFFAVLRVKCRQYFLTFWYTVVLHPPPALLYRYVFFVCFVCIAQLLVRDR